MVRLLVAGDLFPGGRNAAAFAAGDREALLGPLGERLARADLVVANLECPLVDRPSPATKSGWVLGAPRSCAAGIAACGIHAVGFGNNHTMDHGPAGLESTLAECAARGVGTFGAGYDLTEARRPLLRRVHGSTIGLLAATEPEFAAATAVAPGASPLELASLACDVRRAALDVDHLVVLLHAGLEGHPYPTPRLQLACRLLLELGARAVICQHSHVVGCAETYASGVAVYGQGNFIFDWTGPTPPGWRTGSLLELDLGAVPPAVELVPLTQHLPGARPSDPAEAAGVIEGFRRRSEEILDTARVEYLWRQACAERREGYLAGLAAGSRFSARLLRRFCLGGVVLGSRRRLYLQAMLRAGHHRELLEEILR
jgi:poly-gamma-glutamate synthesis protein (capsule biosynthesis protein)